MRALFNYVERKIQYLPDDIAQRLHDGGHGSLLTNEGDFYAVREMYEMGSGRSVYLVNVKPGMRVLDIGAHNGTFAVWAAQQGAWVTAYEPNPLVHVSTGHRLQIEVRKLGVRGSSGSSPFFADPDNSIGSSFNRENTGIKASEHLVEFVSFDEALGDGEWDIVKIDAEGSEYEMLLSSCRLKQIRHLAFEWHCPDGQRDCLELYETVEKLKEFFEVPPVDLTWRILSMRRKGE